ncbi:uncharacterized protein [Scyliorhinus torazame]|uniref:uncharacterized protein n=1 Tax=Scyliorhinus torazame TaxID=75743 RepID=UPI003B5BEAC7
MQVLHSRVSPKIYNLIEEAEDFDAAIELLKGHYIHPVNQVYARHLLATRRQTPGESLEEFYRALVVLGRKCSCPQVSASEHTELLVRDTFVAGMLSSQICKRLLEKDTLGLKEARALAGSLDVASRNACAYVPDRMAAPWAAWNPSAAAPETSPIVPQPALQGGPNPGGHRCYFCGQAKHPRQRCPARATTCKGCGKKGHFVGVCQARAVAVVSGGKCGPPPQTSPWSPCGQRSPPSSYSRATCGSREPPSCPTDATLEGWAPPFCAPPTMCDQLEPPSWMNPQDPSSADHALPEENSQLLRLDSVTLDQSQPRTLSTATTTVFINGHETSCLIDSGSTESFIHPDAEVLLWDLAPDLAGSIRTHPAPKTRAGAQVGPVGREGPPAPC